MSNCVYECSICADGICSFCTTGYYLDNIINNCYSICGDGITAYNE